MFISKNTAQRITNAYKQPEGNICKEKVSEISLDGGSVCLRTGEWKQFKTARINGQYHIARFKEDKALVKKLQALSMKKPVYCLGDGHDSVWNVINPLTDERIEILDWYHLNENLYKQKFEKEILEFLESLLWMGRKDEVMHVLDKDNNFRKYLEKNYHRVVNYEYYQKEGIPIGSGAVESSVKQIAARTNLSGARWSEDGVRKILSVRTAYLNEVFTRS